MPTADPEPCPPDGVRIERADGAVIPCEVRRADPPYDAAGCAAWIAIPVGQDIRVQAGDAICADKMPARTTLRLPAGRSSDATP